MLLQRIATWARLSSPWVLHVNTGACNACDIEVLAALAPRFDVERFGILLKPSPRHADVIVITGPVTKQAAERIKRVYEQTPDPKFVIAVGSCTISGGVFQGCYGVLEGVNKIVPVDVYVPGCPPRPDAIIHGVIKLIEKVSRGG
ncbi:MAG: NADH-quinone oxidoreductase subunit B family protein [Candidatus Nezhaarchaeota archaeon]|nr:NADH-quinone oxidoreductase subunit B family protein [Candidatus Nezhaarchaeota archaeon]MCX8142317.1 NADH-quinone oxidoreductase subunit B family protein [Candidatus Nezhaarchaeota archaeon]MDW8050710.1 NADH-quinone oxidoreductase subunit B family protein [Nitrososphaerota archaeon]